MDAVPEEEEDGEEDTTTTTTAAGAAPPTEEPASVGAGAATEATTRDSWPNERGAFFSERVYEHSP